MPTEGETGLKFMNTNKRELRSFVKDIKALEE